MALELRNVLCQSMLKEMRLNGKIVSIGADLDKADGLFPLSKEFPERAFSAGIAEQKHGGNRGGDGIQGNASRSSIPLRHSRPEESVIRLPFRSAMQTAT